MPRYVAFARYTADALASVRKDGYANRIAALQEFYESAGGTLEDAYFPASGPWHLMTIANLPDSKAAFALVSFASSTGVIENGEVFELLTGDEADKAIGLSQVKYRRPGQN